MSAVAPFERSIVPLQTIREVKPGSFIFERLHALPDSFCDEVIRRFEAQPEYHRAGVVGQTGLHNDGIKKTTDLVASDKPDWKDIDEMFFRCMGAALREFRETFPYFKGPLKWGKVSRNSRSAAAMQRKNISSTSFQSGLSLATRSVVFLIPSSCRPVWPMTPARW